ncbi:hypothetical protein ACRQ5Q_03035 [Bradyrhizobium sp. PMVTL-01]|uniref:hypothetical protein n=1 Tax=Bradyrhizobium sp. PMVTL-01 TaxID=3434999 RepID=UPI003F71913C
MSHGNGWTVRKSDAPTAIETQHMTPLLQDGPAFKTFFDKQVAYWGKVVKDNNIRTQGPVMPDAGGAQN